LRDYGWDEELLRTLRAGDCIAFVGAGFTRAIDMPLWRELLNKLVEAVGRSPESTELVEYAKFCIKENLLPRAASVLRNADVKGKIDSILRSEFDGNTLYTQRQNNDPKKIEMKSRLEALTSLPWAGYITTNYDTLITEYLNENRRPCKIICGTPYDNLARALKSSDRPFFIHLHGNIASQLLILSEDDYDEAYLGSPPLQNFLRAVLLRYTIVFIGTQVEDRFVELRRQLQLLFRDRRQMSSGPEMSREYVLLSDIDRQRGKYLESTGGFRAIYYENATKNHEGIVPALLDLRRFLTKYDGAGGSLDPINQRLLDIIKSTPDGIRQSEITEKFWEHGSLTEISNSELYFRLFFLIYKNLITLDKQWETFKPLNYMSEKKRKKNSGTSK